MNVFSQKLKELRLKKNCTQKEAAESIGISRIMLSNYERGAREPDLQTLCSIADYYETTIDYLLGHCNKSFKCLCIDKNTMNIIWNESMFLTDESKKDLIKYIELLKLQDKYKTNAPDSRNPAGIDTK